MSNTENAKYGRLTALLVAAWLASSITASKLLIFHAGSKYAVAPPAPLGLAVLVPIVLFVLWFAASRSFREFALSLNPFALTTDGRSVWVTGLAENGLTGRLAA